ncbi:unnamed protein product [Tilletia laevis]|uniref:Uncharacterized protein n=3 Tax=Tilletia TaxID=13289 RepID=A0A8X7MWA7_9BASI|nr:hypothetical protein CF328_g5075 [Tilletia controversa]KAE8201416.1 hypothetical protein CF336_g211 [Tilletia laevis]KAE8262485.1 hypothetical protein A4X03_0g2417 [Tilletia caries]KAE8207915.1 hypothetical protein CF335_g797 [Tilletia laevis]KAE8249551.1 hypothetical protein A4X06_0g3179 [Tilletia controversa]
MLQWAQLEARSAPPVAPGSIGALQVLYLTHYANWQRLAAEAQRLGLDQAEDLPDDAIERIGSLISASREAKEAMELVLEQMRAHH